MGVSSRREREKQERRAVIQQAARELFCEKGLHATTMDDIAERAEYGKGTIYNYFKSKDDLYVSIIEEGFIELERRLTEAVKRKRGAEQRVKAVFFAYIDYNLENLEYFRITLHFMNEEARENISKELLDELNDIIYRIIGFSAGIVQEGLDSGVMRNDIDPLNLCLIGWRMATGLLELALVDGVGARIKTDRKLFEDAIDVLIEGSRRKG